METFHAFNVVVNPAIIMALCSLTAMAVMALGSIPVHLIPTSHWRFRVGVALGGLGFGWYIAAIVVAIILGK